MNKSLSHLRCDFQGHPHHGTLGKRRGGSRDGLVVTDYPSPRHKRMASHSSAPLAGRTWLSQWRDPMECPEYHPVPDRDKATVHTSCHCARTKCEDHVFSRDCAEEIKHHPLLSHTSSLHPQWFLKCKMDDARMWSKVMPGTRYYAARLVYWQVSLELEAGMLQKCTDEKPTGVPLEGVNQGETVLLVYFKFRFLFAEIWCLTCINMSKYSNYVFFSICLKCWLIWKGQSCTDSWQPFFSKASLNTGNLVQRKKWMASPVTRTSLDLTF